VIARRQRFGANDVFETAEPAWKSLLRDTVRDPMLAFLLATGGLYAALGERAEAWTLLLSTIPLVAMDALLHRRTQASLAGLRRHLVVESSVVRAGLLQSVPPTELVPGDRVLLRADELFPADGLLLAGDDLQVDESALTGEAYPVRKRALPGPTAAGGARSPGRSIDALHWAHAGTRLLTGRAELRVVKTGAETLYGEIVLSSRTTERIRTPLQRVVDRLVRGLLGAATFLCVLLAAVRLLQGFGWADALVSALTLAVAALPEEFPVILTVFLGVGAYRLARRKALVRRSASVENIGQISCICSDKTGTITRGELALVHRLPSAGSSESRLLERAARASRAESGDPLDEAILRAAAAAEDGNATPGAAAEILATFPFTEDRRRETVVFRVSDSRLLAVVKGAPELLLSLSSLDPAARAAVEADANDLASQGHKVIACASLELPAQGYDGHEPGGGLCFEGLLAFEDPVREGVADAVAQCREAGIRVVMVTGDHPGTALAVAKQIGLGGDAPIAIAGDALDAFLAEAQGDPARLARFDVVVRAMPAQKLALVKALQAAGELVAVTGDGVNDVPALQAADVGIAMSERATRSAREAAAIVLLDDCFTTIVAAIAEGRQLFWNLKRSFRYLLTIHIPLVLTAALIPLAGHPLLFLPIHIVWLELVIHPSALLGFQELPEQARLAATRARSGARLFEPGEWLRIALGGGLLTAFVAFGFLRSLGADAAALGHGRAMALACLGLASAITVAGLSRLRTTAARWIVVGTVGLSALLIQVPALAERVHVSPLHLEDWGLAALAGLLASLPLLVESTRVPARQAPGLAPLRRVDVRSATP
jgi:Ca2+-transporting ATPase